MKEPVPPIVYLVDDHQPFRQSTALLLETVGIEVLDFPAGPALLERLETAGLAGTGACVVSDIRMPGMSGLELLEQLRKRHQALPIIFVTAHADVPLAVEAMRRGAAHFLEKPFSADVLIDAIRMAASPGRAPGSAAAGSNTGTMTNPRLATLTRRERQVLELVVGGKLNKTIAEVLGISTKTVELHRASLMAKLGVRNVPDLVKVYLGYQ